MSLNKKDIFLQLVVFFPNIINFLIIAIFLMISKIQFFFPYINKKTFFLKFVIYSNSL